MKDQKVHFQMQQNLWDTWELTSLTQTCTGIKLFPFLLKRGKKCFMHSQLIFRKLQIMQQWRNIWTHCPIICLHCTHCCDIFCLPIWNIWKSKTVGEKIKRTVKQLTYPFFYLTKFPFLTGMHIKYIMLSTSNIVGSEFLSSAIQLHPQ